MRHGVISGVGSGYGYLSRHIQALDMFFNCMTVIIVFHMVTPSMDIRLM